MLRKIPRKFIIPRFELSQLSESKLEFTILSESLTTRHEIHAAWEIFKDKREFKDMVPLNPARVILHELVVVMQCYIKQESNPDSGDETFNRMISVALLQIKQSDECTRLVAKLTKEYCDLKQTVMDYLSNGEVGDLLPDEQGMIKELLAGKNQKSILGTAFEGITQGLQAMIYMKRAREDAHKLAYTFLVQQSTLAKLPLVAKKDAITIFTAGGPGSGKTTSLSKIAKAVSLMYKVEWDEIVHTDMERVRKILFLKTPDQFGCLTRDEARVLKTREVYVMSSAPPEASRHHLEDTVVINPKRFQKAAMHGKATIACVISTTFENALERSYKRGLTEARYTSTSSLINAHKEVPNSIIEILNQDGISGTNTTVFMYDNNGSPGEDSVLFCTINCQSNEILIHDEDKLQAWINKSKLNTSIALPTQYNPDLDIEVELYTGPDVTITEYFAPLNNRGYQMIESPFRQQFPGIKNSQCFRGF